MHGIWLYPPVGLLQEISDFMQLEIPSAYHWCFMYHFYTFSTKGNVTFGPVL